MRKVTERLIVVGTRKGRTAMKIGRRFESCLFSLIVLFFVNTAVAETVLATALDKKDLLEKKDLIEQAKTDGALFVQASFCKYAEDDMVALMEKQIKDALALAKNNNIDFDFAAWKAEAEPSMDEMKEMLVQLPRSGENYEKNCAEIKAEVAEKLAQKIP
jgi:hypothetical protein